MDKQLQIYLIEIFKGEVKNGRKNRWKANSDKLTKKDLDYIKWDSRKPPCSPNPDFYADDMEGELFNTWVDRQPIFNLREERFDVL